MRTSRNRSDLGKGARPEPSLRFFKNRGSVDEAVEQSRRIQSAEVGAIVTARITSIHSDLANAPEPSTSHALRSDSRNARDSHRRQTTQHLFEELGDSSDAARRRTLNQRIVEANMPVAASIARRYVGRGEGQEDLEQVAYVGLSKAVMGFDPRLDKDFLSYAVPTITGEIKKHFRDHCWSVRPPRRIQELQAQISGAREALVQDLGIASLGVV